MKIYNLYSYEYIPGHGDAIREHICTCSNFEKACDEAREWIRDHILCDELKLDIPDDASDEEIAEAYKNAEKEIEEYLKENRTNYDLDKWTQNSDYGGYIDVDICEQEIK